MLVNSISSIYIDTTRSKQNFAAVMLNALPGPGLFDAGMARKGEKGQGIASRQETFTIC